MLCGLARGEIIVIIISSKSFDMSNSRTYYCLNAENVMGELLTLDLQRYNKSLELTHSQLGGF